MTVVGAVGRHAARTRPAETTGGLGAVACAAAVILGAPEQVVALLGITAGALPALVTQLVAHGGVRGLWRQVWGGNTQE